MSNYAAAVATRSGFEAFIRNEIVIEKPTMPVARAEEIIRRTTEAVGDSRAARRRFLTHYASVISRGRLEALTSVLDA